MMADAPGATSSQNPDPRLQLAYYRALELAQFRGGFLARTAHELRSPINKVISLQQMILEGLCDNPEEEREFIAESQAASLKLLEYLDFLIRVSKIEAGRLTPEMQQVALAPIFNQVKEMTHLQAADRSLRLIVEPPDDTLHVWTDPSWLRNALATLVEIAIDSCDRGTIRLVLAPEAPPDSCYIWIEDDRPATQWQESATLPMLQDFDLEDTLSTSLRMGMVETTLKAIDSQLSILSTSSTAENSITRLQCSLSKQATHQ
ncbi:MAG: HAMP domain-containing histidine kinase [Leptolyngbya sp. SIO1D8]|nr:HAMP domain-containing histidine kinase [Leptolyngbya sp. SIO1D8]